MQRSFQKTALFVTVMTSSLLLADAEVKTVPKLPPLRSDIPSFKNRPDVLADNLASPEEIDRSQSNADMAKVVPVKCKKPKGKFPWNYDRARLSDVLDQVSRLTCKNFIISSSVKPTQEISIISRTPISINEAWQGFLSALEANDLALVQVGSFQKLVKRSDSIRQAISVLDSKDQLPANEGMVTYLYDLKNVSKEAGLSLVKGLISRTGDAIVVGDGFLAITDGASNIKRMVRILEKIDLPGASNRIHIVDLVHADAQQVQQKLTEIFDVKGGRDRYGYGAPPGGAPAGGGNDTGSVQKIIADDRTNKLIVIASDKGHDRIKEVVAMLDMPASDTSLQGQVNVYYLKNGDSKKIATTLTTLTQNMKSNRNQGGRMGGFRGDGNDVFEGEIKVTADEATNSLVILANPRDYKSLSQVIAKLDKKRAQVYVEAVIMDIGLSDEQNMGLGMFGLIPSPVGGGVGILANPSGVGVAKDMFGNYGKALAGGGNPGAATMAGLAGFLNTIGFMGAPQTISLNGANVTIPGVGVVLDMLQTFSNVDVLSTPSLMTLDNEKAEMSVGEQIPVISGASTIGLGGGGGGGLGIPIQNITNKDVKLKLGITPHVNNDGMVRLEIDQDINELGQEVELMGSKQYRVRTKAAKTTVMAQDQQTIVMGGLMDQRTVNTEVGLPVLKDLPWIGKLFSKTSKKIEKKNLLLVLTPYVIRSNDDLKKIHERKIREREEFGKLYFGNKISRYDPYVDYDKKTGPLGYMIASVGMEMQKLENGGKGLPGEVLIKSKEEPAFLTSPKPAEPLSEDLDVTAPAVPPSPSPPAPVPETIMPNAPTGSEGSMPMGDEEEIIIDSAPQQVQGPNG